MKPSDVKTKHLVLLGAGHAHLVFLKRLGMDPIPGLKVTLLNPDRCALYSGLLPGVIGGHFSTDDMQINLGPLCQFAGADFMVGAAVNDGNGLEEAVRASKSTKAESSLATWAIKKAVYPVSKIDDIVTVDLAQSLQVSRKEDEKGHQSGKRARRRNERSEKVDQKGRCL